MIHLRNRLRQPFTENDCAGMKMVGIQDIAQRAGVSKTTVSHVLNHSRPVHPVTVERVLKAVRELNYKPNMLARSLRRRETRTIGLVISDIDNPYFTEVARSVEATAYERGYNVILCNTDENVAKEAMYVDVLFAKQVDGVILAPAPGDHAFLKPYLDNGAQIVLVNRYLPGIATPAVIRDDDDAMYALASRLLDSGHRRLAAIIGLEDASTTQLCLAGLQRALERYGLTIADMWLFPGHARAAGGYQAAQALVDLVQQPTALIAFNRLMLDGVLLGLLDLAPHLIHQIEITGFGYAPLARACQSCKYYVAQPTYELGRVAVTILLDALTGIAPLKAEHIVLRNQLTQFSLVAGAGPDWATFSNANDVLAGKEPAAAAETAGIS
jgi:DNA-binding LacI/PurR family transcriptional regulator